MTRTVRHGNWSGQNARARGGLALAVLVLGVLATRSAPAQTFSVLYNFTCAPDGAYPYAGLVRDAAGNLYGTTIGGGSFSDGTVFKIDTTGDESVLHSFTGGADGEGPYAGLVFADGYLYGAASAGGPSDAGVVFKMTTRGKETVLHSFTGGDGDGAYPEGNLARDAAGNLYGTTYYGGASDYGVVFKVDTTNMETVLHSFAGYPTDGAYPHLSSLLLDTAGNLYGTTYVGGAYGDGVVFKLDTTNEKTVLHNFTGGADGGNPFGALFRNSAGSLYGTASTGGTAPCSYNGCGVVFRVSTTDRETALYSFAGSPTDGQSPMGGLVRDSAGNLYGTTPYGGAFDNGVVFKLDTTGKETVLHSFSPYSDGAVPQGSLVRDPAGNLYGTTNSGGASNCGVVFKLTP